MSLGIGLLSWHQAYCSAVEAPTISKDFMVQASTAIMEV